MTWQGWASSRKQVILASKWGLEQGSGKKEMNYSIKIF